LQKPKKHIDVLSEKRKISLIPNHVNMKRKTNLLLSGLMAALFCSTGNAQQIIYSNSFTGGTVTINGTAPMVSSNLTGGTNTALWICTCTNSLPTSANGTVLANGTIGTNAGSALLPFKPQSGAVYYLTASVYLPAANNWIGMGFSQTATQGTNGTSERFTDPNVKGNPWMDVREGSTVNLFGGPETSLSSAAVDVEPTVGTYTLTIILNTLGAKWTTSAFINGVLQGTNVVGGAQLGTNIVYGSNPTIGYVGLTQQPVSTTGIQWNYLALSTALQPIFAVQPASLSVSGGANVTNTVLAVADTNGGPISYQWYDNNALISNATNVTLAFNPVGSSNAGTNFFVVASNTYGAVTSAVATLTVYTNPVFTTQYPVSYTNPIILYGGTNLDGTNYVGSTPTFSVSVLGQLPASYQWLTNGVPLDGATNSSLTFTNCQMGGPTSFACVVTNSFGANTSQVWSVSYLPTPEVSYPQAVLAAQPVGYWRLNEQPDNGSGDDGTVADDYASGNNGIYTNAYLGQSGYSPTTDPTETSTAFGEASSINGYVGQIQGVNFSAPTGSNAEFTVEGWARGYAPVGGAPVITKGIYGSADAFGLGVDTSAQRYYQFYVRGASGTLYTADATNSSAYGTDGTWHQLVGVCDEANGLVSLYIDGKLSASTSIPATAGDYATAAPVTIGAGVQTPAAGYTLEFVGYLNDVAAYNYAFSSGQVGAQFGAVGGVQPSFVQSPPASVTNNAGTSLTLPATLFGTPPMGYYWTDLNAGTNVAAGTTNSILLNAGLTIPSVPANWNGDQLELTVTNAYGTATFTVYLNVVSGAPQIVTDVQTPFGAVVGGTASNSVIVAGSAPFYYQWQFNGVNLTNNGQITGSQSSVLTISDAQGDNAGDYQVIVSNSYDSVTSSVATLIIENELPIGFNGTGLSWSANNGSVNYTTPEITNGLLTLTDGHDDESRAFFFDYPQYIGAFKASFTYQATAPAGYTNLLADGASFCIQNDPRGASAVGGIGGDLGIALNGPNAAIVPSVELDFDIYPNNGLGGVGYSLQTNGTIGGYGPPGSVSLTNGPVDVSVYYANGQMALTFSNEISLNTFSTNLMVGDLTRILGTNNAYVGFTGASGGDPAIQTITNFSFVSIPTAAIQLDGASALISWPGVIAGYTLQQNADLSTTNWVDATSQADLTNGLYQVTVPLTVSNQFYRLILQP
jgi:hypothetical protein